MTQATPMEPGRVLVAMSGGVDSSLAAALLKEQGHDVFGVTLHLWDAVEVGRCCAPEDRDDARRTCEQLGIPHYVIDEREAFRRHVVDPFVAENLAGRTPAPCVGCNQHVKLTRLWSLAQSLGALRLATGHYCRLGTDDRGRPQLLRGRDRSKDQSYFLFGTPGAILGRMLFPLGDLNKGQARLEARRLGLPNWDKPDSQELCFIPGGDVAGFVRSRTGQAPRAGPIVDEEGDALGTHPGIEGFTVGQRRGLGLGGAGPARYVLRVVAERDELVVGSPEALLGQTLEARDVAWTAGRREHDFRAQVRIRYSHQPAPATVTPLREGFHVRFDTPQRAAAPGQAAVIYEGDQVVAGGYIY